MAVEFLVNRLKALFVLLLGIFRRALCCLRRRRRSSCDSIPLSAVGVIPNSVSQRGTEQEHWEQWDDNSPVIVVSDKPVNIIQTKIEQYRQQVAKPPELNDEPQINYFEDMTPKITKQRKILLRDSRADEAAMNLAKFAVATGRLPTNQLEAWDENTRSWEEETVEEFGDPTQALREQRRRERERRLYEQQQRRIEQSFRPQPIGEKISS